MRKPERRIDDTDRRHLARCVELAREALEAGHQPFGSILVSGDGIVLMEDHNRTGGGDATRHPEFAIARWAAQNMPPEERRAATVYTSGEHCAMCSAAHGWVGLGRIVYASSAKQLEGWVAEFGDGGMPVAPLRIEDVAPGIPVDGPVSEFADEIRALHRRARERRKGG